MLYWQDKCKWWIDISAHHRYILLMPCRKSGFFNQSGAFPNWMMMMSWSKHEQDIPWCGRSELSFEATRWSHMLYHQNECKWWQSHDPYAKIDMKKFFLRVVHYGIALSCWKCWGLKDHHWIWQNMNIWGI